MKKVWVICWEDMYLLIWSNGDRVNLFKEVNDNNSGVDDPKFIWWKLFTNYVCIS
jgi:hypothetical protein